MSTIPDVRRASIRSLAHAITGDHGNAAYGRARLELCTPKGAAIADGIATDYSRGLIDKAEVERRCAAAIAAAY